SAEDLAAFGDPAAGADGKVYLSASNTCATRDIPLRIAVDGRSARSLSGIDYGSLTSRRNLCLDANGETSIAAQPVSISLVVSQAGHVDSGVLHQGLTALEYNGPVVQVANVNPASNAEQQSYLRVVNPSPVAGRVTIEGFCDDGSSQGTAGFTLGAGQAQLVTAQSLESGRGLDMALAACPAGKSRLVVTAEFAEMQVQNFLRNVTGAGLINTNVNNEN